MAGDDAGLDDGLVIGGLLHAVEIDAFAGEEAGKGFGVRISADEAKDGDVAGEFAEIAGDVCRAAGVLGLAVDLHDGNGGLRRDAADTAPDELVEDEIADDQDARLGEGAGDFLEAAAIHSCSATAAKSRGTINS